MRRASFWWMLAAIAAWCLLPWYMQEDGLLAAATWRGWPSEENAPALVQALSFGRWWLWPLLAPLLIATVLLGRQSRPDERVAAWLIALALAGLVWLLGQGFAIGARGLFHAPLKEAFPDFEGRQFGFGWGAAIVAMAYLFLLTDALALRGALRGDAFVLGTVGFVVATTVLFVFFPVVLMLFGAGRTDDGYDAGALLLRIFGSDIWSFDCLSGVGRCGTLWKTLLLAVIVATVSTLLGLAFALMAERTGFRHKRLLRVFALLPIITPPFVVALAIIVLFGRTGAVTAFLDWAFGIPPSRYIYGLPGLIFAQVLSFTPVAFLIMVGVVQGISPSMEEAAQTLRASRARVFRTVTLPLMRPGLANAFLITVLESISDFGNGIVLAGNYDVLSVQIYFALVGAQSDPGRAAALALVLLAVALAVFAAQALWLGQRSYTTVSGKGDSGLHAPVADGVARAVRWTAIPWAVLTAVIYGLVAVGGFVENFGRDYTPTLKHATTMFSIGWGDHGLVWSGGAWNSFFTTMESALFAAPLTAIMGILTAYVLARQRFAGKGAFEFVTMMSFAIPGTVIGISYIVAFNTPPVELTGTLTILIICFIFRDMPVGIRAGVAAMSQIDPHLDESSLTLRHGGFATLRRVILPLIRPAIVAGLVFGLVRAMTSLSAVVFLVTTRHDLATSYIVGRVEISDFGGAILYSAVLVAVMAAMIGLIQLAVGERRLGRRGMAGAAA